MVDSFIINAFWMVCVGVGGIVVMYNVLKLVEEGGL